MPCRDTRSAAGPSTTKQEQDRVTDFVIWDETLGLFIIVVEIKSSDVVVTVHLRVL